MVYYLSDGKNKIGPLSFEQLKEQKISESALIWSEDMTEWKPVTEFAELKAYIINPVTQPPLTPHQVKTRFRDQILRKATVEGIWVICIVWLLAYVLSGGLSSDSYLKRLYPDSGVNAIYAEANEIRYQILPWTALLLFALPISIIFIVVRFYYLKKLERRYIEFESKCFSQAAKEAIWVLLGTFVVIFTFSGGFSPDFDLTMMYDFKYLNADFLRHKVLQRSLALFAIPLSLIVFFTRLYYLRKMKKKQVEQLVDEDVSNNAKLQT